MKKEHKIILVLGAILLFTIGLLLGIAIGESNYNHRMSATDPSMTSKSLPDLTDEEINAFPYIREGMYPPHDNSETISDNDSGIGQEVSEPLETKGEAVPVSD